MSVEYRTHDHISAPTVFPALVDLYAVVYAEPPYREGPDQVSRFAVTLPADAMRAGFTLVTAEEGDRLIGAAYGWIMAAGRWWSSAELDPPPEVLASDKFAVMEWLVAVNRRGQGIGAKIMRRLLAGRHERYGTLASDPRAAARGMYARAGWRQVGRSRLEWGTPMDLLVLDLNSVEDPAAQV